MEAVRRRRSCGRERWGAAHVSFYGGDWEVAVQRATEALAMAEDTGDEWAAARALNTLGVLPRH